MPKRSQRALSATEVRSLEETAGLSLVRTLAGHTKQIARLAWSPDGKLLASPSFDKTIRLSDSSTGKCRRVLASHRGPVTGVAFAPSGKLLASSSQDGRIRVWEVPSGKLLLTLTAHANRKTGPGFDCIAIDPVGATLAAGAENRITFWDLPSGRLRNTLEVRSIVQALVFHPADPLLAVSQLGFLELFDVMASRALWSAKDVDGALYTCAFDPSGRTLAAAGRRSTVHLWSTRDGKLLRSLEGHTGIIDSIAFSSAFPILASKSNDQTVRLWHADSGQQIAVVAAGKGPHGQWPSLAFHPTQPLLAIVGSISLKSRKADKGDKDNGTGSPSDYGDTLVHIWKFDLPALLKQAPASTVTYTSAKVVLVGDSGVGKTGLGWRLAHGEFREHSSTHGQQFWLMPQLSRQRADGTECEAVLWDLAGQPDYRLIHALFIDDADLALVLFDPTRTDDPLQGVEFWLKQLGTRSGHYASPPEPHTPVPTLLVAARSDRGSARLTSEELAAFVKSRGLAGYLSTSARSGDGVIDLVASMKALMPWDDKPATVTTATFKRVKDYVLQFKENSRRRKVILTPTELRQRLHATDRHWKFSDSEMLTAASHLATHGYITQLRSPEGESRILLVPELLNNLAASFVLEARRNQKGLGSLEEQKLLGRGYTFPELTGLANAEQEILLDAATRKFLKHNVCFRETDPLSTQAYLVFPELINLKKPPVDDGAQTEDGAAYTVIGAVENVYSSLVVLLGYTHTFTRTNQWHNHARYEVGDGLVCGFRLDDERDGELDLVLYFGTGVGHPIRTLFQSLFESFLARRNLTVKRVDPLACENGHLLNRAVLRERFLAGSAFTFCNECGARVLLPKSERPIQLTKDLATDVDTQRRAADQRSRFEQVLFRMKTYASEQRLVAPHCFISYAWGDSQHERWVERSLATDLLKAGILVILDRWENARFGSNIPRFVERVGASDRVIVVGTILYRTKYENQEPMRGFVVAAEGDLIGKRMIGTEALKETVIPVLLEGNEELSFPHLLQGRVYADFRDALKYFDTTLEVILNLYGLPRQHPFALELQESLEGAAK